MTKLQAAFLVLQCTLCLTIRVPVNWEDNSDINSNEQLSLTQDPVQDIQANIPKQYFQYTANKPQFAIDIAAAHGVESPEKLYTSHPVNPYTGETKPSFGQHLLLDPQRENYRPYQSFVNKSQNYVKPTSTSFEVYHPYKAEEPALQELYRDPVLNKIRNDVRDSKNRLHKYENDAGEPNIEKDEYLESPEKTDHKHQPHRNFPTKYEVHRPRRRPIYYRPPMKNYHRENILNKKFKHPLYQTYAKITPMHFHPIKNHLQHLRQQHALKFDDEHNEYPQLSPPEPYAVQPDGYDIYENGKAKYIKLRNNVDETLNKITHENRPSNSEKLELQNEDEEDEPLRDENEEFVPIKNYAQVRKTETTKHLPREKAFEDADSYDEIKNAPRLREAIKSTKAQIVYSEEGYEDSAYDHAGELKHASDHEGHGGHLKEDEHSKGKYKIPSVSYSNDDSKGSAYRDQILHGKKWQDSKKENQKESDSDDYAENEDDVSADSDIYSDDSEHESTKLEETVDVPGEDQNSDNKKILKLRRKRQNTNVDSIVNSNIPHDHNQNKNVLVPELDLDSVVLIPKSLNLKDTNSNYQSKLMLKYPYYFRELRGLNNDSPLRYSENLTLIPKKSHGGTEFYDSRSTIACSEVDDEVDPIPETLKTGEKPKSGDSDKKVEFRKNKQTQRLKGLGDKIDCFKAKYFGENPLDSPFFNEDIIPNPKPVVKPNIDIFSAKYSKTQSSNQNDLRQIWDKNKKLNMNAFEGNNTQPEDTKSEIIMNNTFIGINNPNILLPNDTLSNVSFNIQDGFHEYPNYETNKALILRKKRSNAFVYEPYKIIKESQMQDSKKTTTTSNISPLIKQLQSSRLIDRGNVKHKDQPIKRNTNSKAYQDIGKLNRGKYSSEEVNDQSYANIDKRRGEPRYESEHANHQPYYTPVENKAAMSLEDYEQKLNNHSNRSKITLTQPKIKNSRRNIVVSEVSQPLNYSYDTQNIAASNTVKNVLRTTTVPISETDVHKSQNEKDEEEYDEYDDDDDDDDDDDEEPDDVNQTSTRTIVTTAPTVKKIRRHETQKATTTDKSIESDKSGFINNSDNKEVNPKTKLKLITRFNHQPTGKNETKKGENSHIDNRHSKSSVPQYKEKKKKVSKSTVVTDTKTYGDEDDDDDDMRKDEVDAMIKVQQDIDEYMPSYEKNTKKSYKNEKSTSKENSEEDDEEEEEDEEDEEEEDEEKLDDNEEDEDEGEDSDIAEKDDDNDDDELDDNDDNINDNDNTNNDTHKNDENVERSEPNELEMSTLGKKRKIILQTKDTSTTATLPKNKEIDPTPKIMRKKIEILQEVPANKSSPHISQYKQEIKEIEIIKEMPPRVRKKHQKNVEHLELYKDENLAKDINKLGGVEIFKENLDLKSGPRHGGNYRSLKDRGLNEKKSLANTHSIKGHVEPSQSETKKLVESQLTLPYTRRNILIAQNEKAIYPNEARNAKITDTTDTINPQPPIKSMRGGNLKSSNRIRSRGNAMQNAKYIELVDEESDKDSKLHGGNLKSYDNERHNMRGGNYRNAKLVESIDKKDIVVNTEKENQPVKQKPLKGAKNNAATLLSGFARAVPILTTTPIYILDPSKRMYYYVDT